jgi:hypothetical protein
MEPAKSQRIQRLSSEASTTGVASLSIRATEASSRGAQSQDRFLASSRRAHLTLEINPLTRRLNR